MSTNVFSRFVSGVLLSSAFLAVASATAAPVYIKYKGEVSADMIVARKKGRDMKSVAFPAVPMELSILVRDDSLTARDCELKVGNGPGVFCEILDVESEVQGTEPNEIVIAHARVKVDTASMLSIIYDQKSLMGKKWSERFYRSNYDAMVRALQSQKTLGEVVLETRGTVISKVYDHQPYNQSVTYKIRGFSSEGIPLARVFGDPNAQLPDGNLIAAGRKLVEQKCFACHNGGNISLKEADLKSKLAATPSFMDTILYRINPSTAADLRMPRGGNPLTQDEFKSVKSYAESLK